MSSEILAASFIAVFIVLGIGGIIALTIVLVAFIGGGTEMIADAQAGLDEDIRDANESALLDADTSRVR